MAAVIAIDAGTTGVRSRVVYATGPSEISSYREFTQHFPQPGWVEHDAEEIWTAVLTTLQEVISQLNEPIATIGITNQRETVVAWSRKSGKPYGSAIVWQDRRTAGRCEQLVDHLSLVRQQTGLVLDPYFSGTKFAWLIDNRNFTVDHDLCLGTIDSWLIFKLTGHKSFVTDPTNASRTMLFDIKKMCWSDELCELLRVPMQNLPTVLPSSGHFGSTVEHGALPAGIAISGVAGDQQAALFGQACFTTGATKNTYGTGSFVLMNVGNICPEPQSGILTTVAWQLDSHAAVYALEGAVFVTGAAIQWLRDGLNIIDHASEIGPLAQSVEDSGGIVLVPAFAGLGSPWWDPYARGSIFGITRGTTRAHLARATIESIVFQTRDVVESMSVASGVKIKDLRVDGGAAVVDFMLQLQADHLNCAVLRPKQLETTAMGAAYLAGLGAKVWSSTDEITQAWQLDKKFEPNAVALGYDSWQQAVKRSMNWIN
ncbi:MAG: glycerol kinase [Actinobacteria bacterium]|nr:glycerol kinase [Actinomycetota bacterium]NDC99521.1 glycerol kinase [bacterium]NBY61258.1 glycerol kinase [Actinomycetota bacterium]NDA96640.1 glycerol kinase [Actinomycetota bacterium]NDD72193.1 glycerol kinase [Actinomycetota bacterium]